MTHCPRCHQALRRSSGGGGMSADMPTGTVVLFCQTCKQVTVEGSGRWVGVGEGFREALRLLAGSVAEDRRQHEAMMSTPIEDSRWEAIS